MLMAGLPLLVGASALLQVHTPAPATPQPAVSVMIVETGSEHLYVGESAGPFPGAMNVLDERVRVVRRLSGPNSSRNLTMRFIAHQFDAPGVRILVIAEPNSDGPGFLARWYKRHQREGYCVPADRVAELHLETAFARARRVNLNGQVSLCVPD